MQEVRESRRVQEQRIVEVDSGVRRDYEFKLAQALQVRELARHFLPAVVRTEPSSLVEMDQPGLRPGLSDFLPLTLLTLVTESS